MPKKILIFSTAYFPLVGGAEIAVKEITRRLPAWQFDMITTKIQPGLTEFERDGNVNIYRVGFGRASDKLLLPFLGLLKAGKLERKNNYDLTWSIMASFGGFLGLFFKCLHPKKPWLLTLQEGSPVKEIVKKVGIFRPLFYQIFRRADYIQTISRFLADWAKRMEVKCPIEVVPNGVDLKKFSISNPQFSIENLKADFGINPDEKIVITVSRLVKKNGVDDLIKAIKEIQASEFKFQVKLLIAGIGPDEQELKNLVKKLRVEPKILFLGHIPHSKLTKYLTISDVFVRPSLSEGLGNAFLEAMAAGVPIIGTPVGGIPDFLINGETGLFCQSKNPQSIAEKIKRLLSDNQLKQKIIKNGQKLIREKYDWDKIVFKMEKVYLSLL